MGLLQSFQVTVRPLSGEDVIGEFTATEGRYSNFTKEVSFIRYVGASHNRDYDERISQMDSTLKRRMEQKQSGYLRVEEIARVLPADQTAKYVDIYEKWKRDGGKLPFHYQNEMWEQAFYCNYEKLIQMYVDTSGRREETFRRNFGVKVIYWIDMYFPKLFCETLKMRSFPKFVCGGQVKVQEYLFLYFLTMMGCDVMVLAQEKDVAVEDKKLLALSMMYQASNEKKREKVTISRDSLRRIERDQKQQAQRELRRPAAASHAVPERIQERPEVKTPQGPPQRAPQSPPQRAPQRTPVVSTQPPTIPGGVNPFAPPQQQPHRGTGIQQPAGASVSRKREWQRQEGQIQGALPSDRPLDFVELAAKATSIVMISVYNKKGQCFKTGSGVMISSKGYILTNFHVACEGAYYGIRLEEEEEIFYTRELVKYNQYHDLAVLKTDKARPPIPIYRGREKLVRGQKVVAIGSPLGLFNTVSDGIISGFRKMEDVSMIQFTAPISHGSSGGALLDLYGNLIGIITAGVDDGQNLNFAVDYETIQMFAGGFTV
ncbi:trypsin-like peptidase domain-containing protein [Clostridium sp. AM58-1XD]|uniref:trypsin-like peptidase domain-containing protein n=1 Tax=Clostridium sp. AM58-1XD TaxID=2292307 RepID=UPI0015F46737|nr:trypsin-like peptidase domain-containing protein [Clostridium sp. AM58-1XD]